MFCPFSACRFGPSCVNGKRATADVYLAAIVFFFHLGAGKEPWEVSAKPALRIAAAAGTFYGNREKTNIKTKIPRKTHTRIHTTKKLGVITAKIQNTKKGAKQPRGYTKIEIEIGEKNIPAMGRYVSYRMNTTSFLP